MGVQKHYKKLLSYKKAMSKRAASTSADWSDQLVQAVRATPRAGEEALPAPALELTRLLGIIVLHMAG
jgi:hypothetical protein